MSVIDLPVRPRRPRLARTTPAEIVKHPAVPHEFDPAAAIMAAMENLEAEMEADRSLAVVHRELETLELKAELLSKKHGREQQAVVMFENALERLTQALFPKR
jgi:hypothetical protein